MPKKTPILVIVTTTDWKAYSINPTTTLRDRWLFSLLHNDGGVNESVPAGRYHYNARWNVFTLITTLLPEE